MKKPTKQPTKSQLLAEIKEREQQVATIEKRECESAALKEKQILLESERALIVAIDNFNHRASGEGRDRWALTAHLVSARALLERIVKEQTHA